jgi:hypothetical protein
MLKNAFMNAESMYEPSPVDGDTLIALTEDMARVCVSAPVLSFAL